MSDSRRIAKNTLMLYFRQILIMLVSLYTVRVVLSVLGAEDYGIYNVVAGVVTMFGFLGGAMAQSTQRFLNYSLGKNDFLRVRETYSASILIHAVVALIFFIIAETVGLWFVNSKLNVPESRRFAALIIYQFTIMTMIFNIFRVPYNAVVIAYERMSFFAWISIVEAIFKLIVVFSISHVGFDKLISYAFLLMIVSFFILLLSKIYCNVKFEAAHFLRISDKNLIKELLSFSGWTLFGAAANVCNQQGTNIVLNMFTNVTVNAALGIANQVNSAVYSFVSNFQTAFNPQLIKTFAENNQKYFETLLFRSAKISFFLLYFIFLPLFVNMEFVLGIWLKHIPDYTVKFVQLVLVWSLVDIFNNPLYTALQATGDIKQYNMFVGICKLLPLPIIIVFLRLGFSPYCFLYIEIGFSFFIDIWRIFYCKSKRIFKISDFALMVFLPCALVFLPTFFIVSYFADYFIGTRRFFITVGMSFFLNTGAIYFLGLTKSEKIVLSQNVMRLIHKEAEVV